MDRGHAGPTRQPLLQFRRRRKRPRRCRSHASVTWRPTACSALRPPARREAPLRPFHLPTAPLGVTLLWPDAFRARQTLAASPRSSRPPPPDAAIPAPTNPPSPPAVFLCGAGRLRTGIAEARGISRFCGGFCGGF
ncbi:hypothetical protein GQ55_5G066700 [Panicum hallii var. hallii]|uniref:Uncharacterized protein n=1 Tax=Panicum hallii var. hallii TaxID=1504633 RepID=A0A2T7DDG9_9POAL|nr:hypothetical protein GQ55_5G066700 [Panicum hallii var. hallii]